MLNQETRETLSKRAHEILDYCRLNAHEDPLAQWGVIYYLLLEIHLAASTALPPLRLPSIAEQAGFVHGAQECREMMARFVEGQGLADVAASIRANWDPTWGTDPGPAPNWRT